MKPLLRVRDLRKTYRTRAGPLLAVDGVSFNVARGETVALVGESGCGKSTVAMTLLRLVDASGGTVFYDGRDFDALSARAMRLLRRKISIVFQNPYSSLNPKMTVRDIVGEPLVTALGLKGRDLDEQVRARLTEVGLGPEHMPRYPHQFSGGQRQRIAIARALALEPELLILDEPTAALDVSVQAQVLNLLKDLQRQRGLSYLFISHNLATVEFIADRLLVMYLGRIVESGPVRNVFAAPQHPYTRALIDSVPSIDPRRRGDLRPLSGEVPSPMDRAPGCAFAPRCPRADDTCYRTPPPLEAARGNRLCACYHPLEETFAVPNSP